MSDKKDDLRDLKALRDLFDRVGSPSAPLMHKVPNQNVRPHWMSFSVLGEAGQTLSVNVPVYVLFKIDRLVATDSSPQTGYGTEFCAFVGNKIAIGGLGQRVSTSAFPQVSPLEVVKAIVLAKEHSLHDLADTIEREYIAGKSVDSYICEAEQAADVRRDPWPTCPPGMPIAFEVKFLKTCTWYATAYGRTLS